MPNIPASTPDKAKAAAEAAYQPDASLPTNWLSHHVDRTIVLFGQAVSWLWLVTLCVVLTNVFSRFILNRGSVAVEELSWHMFAITMMLTLGYAVVTDQHVRVDVLREKFSLTARAWIELLAIVLLLMPILYLLVDQMIDYAVRSFEQGERSQSASGLPYRFIVKSVLPVGIALVAIAVASRALRCCTLLFGYPRALIRPKDQP